MTGNDHPERVRRQFGASAEHYRTSATHARGRSLARLLALTGSEPTWRVLDVATGAGHAAAALAPRVAAVVASDLTREMLEQAAIVCRENEVSNVYFVMESAESLAYGEATFDLVTCRVAAHHFPEPGRFVAESARVLRPGGLLAVIDNIVPEDDDSAAWINRYERRRDPSHLQCLKLSQWETLYREAGIELAHREVVTKWLELDDWLGRMQVSPDTARQLRQELRDAPRTVREFWRPRLKGAAVELALQEAILLGRRRD